MSSGKIENQILDAVETLVDNAIAHAGFDRTIQAQVARCANENQGKYVIKYQDGLFYAYSSNVDTVYKKGDSVYILIPGNDMSETKTILGLVSNLGADYISTIEEENKYETTGKDCIKEQISVGLCSYTASQEIDLYNVNSTPTTKEGFEFDLTSFEFYLKKSSYFKGGAYFRTTLPEEQRYAGDYGIAYELVFKDNATGTEKTITYKINVDDMEGDPYLLSIASKQYGIWEIDTDNFVRLKRIYVFQNNFPHQASGKTNDIFITNIELMGANAIPTDETSNCSISIITKEGIYFDNNDTSTSKRSIETVIRAKGNVIQADSSLLKYYWFKENNAVGYDSILFQRYGGPGWECLNNYNTIAEGVREWLSGNSTFSIQKSDTPAKENGYKCVAVYNEKTILTKEFTIYNNSSTYNITISSSDGEQFYYDIGETTLKCLINNAEQTGSSYSYSWSVTDNIGEFTKLSETSNSLAVAARTINDYSTYKCIVSYNSNIIGKATIVLKNSLEGSYVYSAIVENGNQVFKYNENGISPASEAVEDPITILPLDFTLYDDTGTEVPHAAIGNSNVEWWVPEDNTMLDVLSSYGSPIRIEDGYEVYTNTYTIGFDIANTYNTNNNDNTIILKVVYKDKKLTAKTNFNFLKEGEIGSNGTDFVCRLVPNIASGNAPKNVILTYNESGTIGNYTLNYNRPSGQSENWLNAELYHNGVNIFRGYQSGTSTEDISENTVTLKWSILKNKYDYDTTTGTVSDDSNLSINESTGAIAFSATEYSNPANIIKCTLTYNGVEYVAAMPVIVARVTNDTYAVSLKENTGFTSTMYTTDGKNPIYNNITPHELILKQDDEEITENENLTYDWSIKGRVYLSEWQSDLNLIIRNITSPHKIYFVTEDTTYQSGKSYYKYENNTYRLLIAGTDYNIGGTIGTGIYEVRVIDNIKYIKPKDTFDGMCVSNGIYCSIESNDIEIANIHIPVYMYLNRYGHSAINGWDGNTISINDEAGIILSPQVGAGHKETDNSFTGVLIGSVKESGSTEIETGLFGYNSGERTIKLDAESGSAEFGTEDSGKIVIDPNDGTTGHAYLRSGDYELSYAHVAAGNIYNNLDLYFEKDNNTYIELKKGVNYTVGQTITGTNIYKASNLGSGMEIDLTDPHIRFGSGKFRVDSDGSVHASEYALVTDFNEVKESVTTLEDTISYFEVSADAASVTIPCDSLHLPSSTTVTIPVNYTGTFKGNNLPIISGSDVGKCIITITPKSAYYTGLTLQSQFDGTNQKIVVSADSAHVISEIVSDYTITFEYRETAEKSYTVTKQLSVVLAIQGADGATGEQGPAGPAGKDGTSVTVKGSYDTLQELLDAVEAGTITPASGDGYIIGNDLYIYTNEGGGGGTLSTDWKDVGQFKGTDAKRCFIVASTEVFRSDNGGTTYTPVQSILTPYFQSVTYSGWSYSIDGGVTFTELSSTLPTGLSLDSTTKALTIQNSCALFTSNLTLVFKCKTDDTNTYDTISISKLKDGVDGAKGDKGDAGDDGEDGNGIDSITYYYKTTTTQTAPAAADITDTSIPTMSSTNKFLWQKEVIHYTKSSVADKISVLLLSIWGDTGKRILSTTVEYQAHTNGTTAPTGTWTTSVPTVEVGKFLWTRTTINYTENGSTVSDSTVSYAVAYRGTNGTDGTSVTISSKKIEYRYNYSGTDPDEQSSQGYSSWSESIPAAPDGSHLWTRTTVNYSNSQSTISYTVAYQSQDGTRGYSIWTTTVAPSSPDYTFTISNLTGPTGETPKVGETILESNRYQYTISEVATTTVKCNTRTDLKGTEGDPAINVICGNEAEAIPCTSNEAVIQDTTITIPFTGYAGTDKQAVTVTKINNVTNITAGTTVATGVTIAAYTAGTSSADGSLQLKFAKDSTLGDSKNNVIIIQYTCNSKVFTKYFSWTKTLDADLKIGGRNYFQNSKIFSTGTPSSGITSTIDIVDNNNVWKIVATSGNANDLAWTHDNTIETNFEEDEKFVFSMNIKANSGSLGIPRIYFKDNMDYQEMQSLKGNTNIGTEYETIYYAGKWKQETTSGETTSHSIDLKLGWGYCSGTFYIESIKFEKGNQATDWTAAPEDINNQISDASNTAQKAENDAKHAQDTADEAKEAADKAKDEAKEAKDTINTRVNETMVASSVFEYAKVKYNYVAVSSGTTFDENIIYYSLSGTDNYTKVRPEVDETNKLKNTYYKKDTLPIPSSSATIQTSKPAWEDGYGIYQRTLITYGDGASKHSEWYLMEDNQTIDDRRYLDSNQVLKTMRGTNNIFYNADGFYCYNGATKDVSTSAIVLNSEGICFQRRNSTSEEWPVPTSVWTTTGTFDAKEITVNNLAADSIANGVLTLGGGGTDGGLYILNDAQDTKNPQYELNSQRFMCRLNNGGYVLIGKDIGLQVLSASNEVQWGSTLTWTSVAAGTTLENNINYYIEEGDFLKLIIPEQSGTTVPTGKTYYTVTCGNTFEIKQQKVVDNLYFGDYIQTVNINATDSSGKIHRGIAFTAKQ